MALVTEKDCLFNQHLTMREQLAPVLRTHLGQAHIAGTGPEGRTCRECLKWYSTTDAYDSPKHEYRGTSDDDEVMELTPAKCQHRIANKANRRVPHSAEACRFFLENLEAPPATRGRLRKAKALVEAAE